MSQQTIIWNQRVLGRDVGDVETLETDTDLMQALLLQGRASVVTVEDVHDPKDDDADVSEATKKAVARRRPPVEDEPAVIELDDQKSDAPEA